MIGIAVATCLAAAFTSLLMWTAGCTQGVPKPRLRRAILTIWFAIFACAAGLFVARLCLGNGVIESVGADGIQTRELDNTGKLAIAGGVAWALVWLLVALRTAGSICGGPVPPPPDTTLRPGTLPDGLPARDGGAAAATATEPEAESAPASSAPEE